MSRPDWVMYGAREGDRFVIYASQTLTRTTLEARVKLRRGEIPSEESLAPAGATLTAQMDDLVSVEGTSYLDALQKLLFEWQPSSIGPPEIEN